MNSLSPNGDSVQITKLAPKPTSNETTIVSARPPVHFPWWVHSMAALVFLVNCAKIPRATGFITNRFSSLFPGGSTLTALESAAANVGPTIFCLLSGSIGALLIYLLYRRRARTLNQTDQNHLHRISLQESVAVLALIFPDLWFVLIGTVPYTSWQFLTIFSSAVALVTLSMGSYKQLLVMLPGALLLGFAV